MGCFAPKSDIIACQTTSLHAKRLISRNMVTNFAKLRDPRKKSRICILSSREFTRRSFDLLDKPSELIERVYGKLH